MIDQLKNYNVNVQFLAELFNVTERTIQNYVGLGLPKTERGEYPLLDCLLWRIKKLEEEKEKYSKENAYQIAKQKALDISNERRTLELEEKKGNLIDKEKVKFSFVVVIKSLMRNLESIPPRLNKKISGSSETLAIIKDEINDFRNLCANTPIPEIMNEIEEEIRRENLNESN